MSKPKIGIVIGSTRENRFADKPANWIYEIAKARTDIEVEIVDLKDYPLPLFAEPALEGEVQLPQLLQLGIFAHHQRPGEDADDNAARSGTRRIRHAHRISNDSAARRLRVDRAWTGAADAGPRARRLGSSEHGARQRGARAIRQHGTVIGVSRRLANPAHTS